jgi:hypothetical protein
MSDMEWAKWREGTRIESRYRIFRIVATLFLMCFAFLLFIALGVIHTTLSWVNQTVAFLWTVNAALRENWRD